MLVISVLMAGGGIAVTLSRADASSTITSPAAGGPLNNDISIEPSPVTCGFDPTANGLFSFGAGLAGTAEPATTMGLPAGSAEYFYVGSDAGGNPLTNISWDSDLSVTAAYSGNEAVSIGQSTSSAASFSSNGTTNVAIAGIGVSGYQITGTPVTASTSTGTSVSLRADMGPGDLLLVLVGGEGVGMLQQGGSTALSALLNVTYSECGSDVIASSGMFAAFLPAGTATITVSGTTYPANSGTSMGAVAYILAPEPGQPSASPATPSPASSVTPASSPSGASASPPPSGQASPAFSLQVTLGAGAVYTLDFYGDQASYLAYRSSGSLALAAASYLVSAVEPVSVPAQPPPVTPIYAVTAWSADGTPVTAQTRTELIDSAFLWAYDYVNQNIGVNLAQTFQDLVANEASQQRGITAGAILSLLDVYGTLIDDLTKTLGDTGADQVTDVISVLQDVLTGPQAIQAQYPAAAAAIGNCDTAAGITLPTAAVPGLAIFTLMNNPLDAAQRESWAACVYTAAYTGQLSQPAQADASGLLANLQDNLISQSAATGVQAAAAGTYSFLMTYFGWQLTLQTSQAAAATALQEAAVSGFIKSALPVALADTLNETFVQPAAAALQQEVDLEGQGSSLAAQLTADQASLATLPVNAALAGQIAQEQGALLSLFALWASSDYAYQATLPVPGTYQQHSDENLGTAAGSDAQYLKRFEQVASTLAGGLATGQLATSSSPAGTASITSQQVSVTATGAGTVAVSDYGGTTPIVEHGFAADTDFFDVAVLPGGDFTSVQISACGVGPYSSLAWYNPATQTWQDAAPATAVHYEVPRTGCVTFQATSTTSPSVEQLTGTVFGVRAAAPSAVASPDSELPWIAGLVTALVSGLATALWVARRGRARHRPVGEIRRP